MRFDKKSITLYTKHSFENRSKSSDKLCIIIAGYKEELWNNVLGRLKKFIPDDYDVCIVSAGLKNEKLVSICRERNWSYLSTKKNNVSLVQNLAIIHHPKAKYLFKLDEDMFIARGFFEKMLETYNSVQKNGNYRIGFVAPLIPINGYGHVRFLEMKNATNEYVNNFGKPVYNGEPDNILIRNIEIAKYLWMITGQIDVSAKDFLEREFQYSICPVRFSIGAILFTRNLWEQMGMFQLGKGNGLGADEEQICTYCMEKSRVIVVAENVLACHLGYGGKQTKAMMKYYRSHKEQFEIEE